MEYIIRKAEEKDIPAIIELAVEMIEHSQSDLRKVPLNIIKGLRHKDLQGLYNLIQLPHTGIFVAEDGEQKIIGHVITLGNQVEPSTGELQGWIFDISVKSEYWKTGLAQKLMEAAENFIKTLGLNLIGLSVTTANKRAVKFYEKLGYQEERKRMLKVLE
jgi:ribosomal protein S18 acetylase RimI-like enzyme